MFCTCTSASTSLSLSEAMWPVFESRGAVKYGSYSIPRQFEAVAQSGNIRNILNMAAFHRTEVSTYTEDPCAKEGTHKQNCPILFLLLTGFGVVLSSYVYHYWFWRCPQLVCVSSARMCIISS